ncbi:hypothetical protein SAMN05446927_7653 [Caballeronia arationis]|uniref:Uncharacterized protein n=1 Tax=Caballeronia arationis TaxID=1777142 RepID=A0A7Z7IFA2_9BURK|nr:hypothetical protein SAMN05446927_7653 [Caballeronia arationis]
MHLPPRRSRLNRSRSSAQRTRWSERCSGSIFGRRGHSDLQSDRNRAVSCTWQPPPSRQAPTHSTDEATLITQFIHGSHRGSTPHPRKSPRCRVRPRTSERHSRVRGHPMHSKRISGLNRAQATLVFSKCLGDGYQRIAPLAARKALARPAATLASTSSDYARGRRDPSGTVWLWIGLTPNGSPVNSAAAPIPDPAPKSSKRSLVARAEPARLTLLYGSSWR